MVYQASTIADWFLSDAAADGEDDDDMTNMKLQKLLYYAQGHWLADHDEPLFSDTIKAWMHGPVVPTVWHKYKESGSNILPIPGEDEFSEDDVTPEVNDFLTQVWDYYGGYSAAGLRTLTHREDPWKDAWNTHDDSPSISIEAMKKWFSKHPMRV